MVSLFGKANGGTESVSSANEEPNSVEAGKVPLAVVADLDSPENLSRDLRNDPEARTAFLATFTAEEEKKIMQKVDNRFLILIGFMFMFKNVSVNSMVGKYETS